MKKALLKDTVKQIFKTYKRFISILLMALLGVGFFAGIRAASPDMKKTVDKYFDEALFYDIQVVSTLGLTEGDVKALEKVEGIEKVYPSFSTDAFITVNNIETVVRIHEIEENINKLKIVEGYMPSTNSECVVEQRLIDSTDLKIGDYIEIKEDSDNEYLVTNRMKIVGTITSPIYISKERGTSSLGSGRISYYMYVPKQNINSDIYTEINISVKDVKKLDTLSEEYDEKVQYTIANIEKIKEERQKARYNELIDEANEELDEATEKLEKEKTEAKEKIEEAEKKLADGKKELKEGKEKLREISKNYVESKDEGGNDTTKKVLIRLDGNDLITTAFDRENTTGNLQLTVGTETTSTSDLQKYLQQASNFSVIIDKEALPLEYEVDENVYNTMPLDRQEMDKLIVPVIVLAVLCVIGIAIRFRKEKIFAVITIIGIVATQLILVRYTNVILTAETISAVVVTVILAILANWMMLKNYTKELNEADAKKNLKDGIIAAIKVLVPVFVLSIVFCFMKWLPIYSFGMTLFWGILTIVLFLVTVMRTLVLGTRK